MCRLFVQTSQGGLIMKSVSNLLTMVALSSVLTLVFVTNRALAQDPVKVSPNVYKVLLENDRVRVLEMKVKPGEKDKLHSHPSEVVHFINGGKVRINLPDGAAPEMEIPDGHVMWHEAWTHVVENIGSSEIYAIIVEIRDVAEEPKSQE